MARPCKQRRICALPCCERFGPQNGNRFRLPVEMTVDEFEAVRLIDLENMTQEQCARQMNVARSTAQAIYDSARAKLAECLVNGRELRIRGGDYVLCDGLAPGCRHARQADQANDEEERSMKKIAVTYENGEIFQHFGHTAQFKVYTVAEGRVAGAEVIGTEGSGHGALAGMLQKLGVDTLICGGIGGGARQALDAAGIRVFGGAAGSADEAVDALLQGSLTYDPAARCEHHDHGEHSCGEHTCGGKD